MSNATNRIEILTPVARLVEGDAFTPNTTDAEGNPLKVKSGPNAGQDRVDYYMGVAVPKTDPAAQELINKIYAAARAGFPNLFDTAGNCIKPGFAFKIIDGDSQIPNSRGTRPCDKEGFAGHWIFKFNSGFAPKVYTTGGASVIVNPEELKRGYYVRIYGSVVSNGSTQQPGVHLNLSMVERIAFGEVISSGPDGAAVFGGAPAPTNLPAGATMTPPAPSATIAQPAAAPAPSAPAPAAPVAPAPVAGVQPAPDFLNPPAAAPAPVVEQFSYQNAVYTRDQLAGWGWTAEQINNLPRA